MKLTDQELETLLSIMRDFSRLSDELEIESTKMDELETQRISISDKLMVINEGIQEIREKEKVFTDTITDKYGPFKFDVQSLEIEPIK
jgi:hypothetical protein